MRVCVGALLAGAGSWAFYVVSGSPGSIYWLLFTWFCACLIGAGFVLLATAGAERFRKAPAPVAPRLHPGTTAGHDRWRPRPMSRRLFPGLHSFGLVAGLVCTTVLSSVLLGRAVLGSFRKGLVVHLLRPEVPLHGTPGLEALWVRVEFAGYGKPLKLYFNGQPISWEDLPGALRKELNRRPPRFPVYVEGDPEGEWRDTVRAIDVVRGLDAEVILLTRKPAAR